MAKRKKKENRLVVGDIGWAETIPAWLLEEVKFERMMYGLGGLINPNAPKVGDAEVAVFLYTASLRAPLSANHTALHIYLTGNLMKRKNKDTKLPDFIEKKIKEGLTEYEERELKSLKEMIYTKRGGEISHPLLDVMRDLKKKKEEGK